MYQTGWKAEEKVTEVRIGIKVIVGTGFVATNNGLV